MIVALCTVLALLAVPTHEQDSQGTTLTSPCPDVFVYDPPQSDLGSWSGVITLTTDILLHSTWLHIVLDSQALKLLNSVGSSTTQDGIVFTIENDDIQIHPGYPVLVRFSIDYDPQNTTPRLREIRLNGMVICKPVLSNVGQPGSSFSGPKLRTNLDLKPVRILPSVPTRPVYQKPVNNNSSAALNPEQRYSNTSTTSNKLKCGVVSGGNGETILFSNDIYYARGDMPWLAAIFDTARSFEEHSCTGTLVSDLHVVTAASCLRTTRKLAAATVILVKLGAHDLNDQSVDITTSRAVESAWIHEDHDISTLQNDIMILLMNKRVHFNEYIRPACLWSGDTELSRVVGATGVVAGWGVQKGVGKIFKVVDGQRGPRRALARIVSTSYCRASNPVFHNLTSDNTFCAGGREGVGPCSGDGGAGLYLLEGGKWRLRGIVSVTLRGQEENGNCYLNEYAVYTDAAQYLMWINDVLSGKYDN